MTGYLLDTDIVIDLLTGRQRGVDLLRKVAPGDVFLCAIVVGEVLEGFARRSHPRADALLFDSFLRQFPILAFDLDCARIFARLQAMLRSNGEPIGDADVMIAATAIQHDLTLLSGNTRHFARINELKCLS